MYLLCEIGSLRNGKSTDDDPAQELISSKTRTEDLYTLKTDHFSLKEKQLLNHV